eukprot:6707842-Prymnesium_polylepis.1
MSDAVDGRSAARCRNTIVWQNITFLQEPPRLAANMYVTTYAHHRSQIPSRKAHYKAHGPASVREWSRMRQRPDVAFCSTYDF